MYKQLSLAVLVVQASMHVLVLRYSRLVPGPKYIASTAVVMSEVIKLVVALGMYYYENKTFNGLSDKLFGPKSQKWHICLVAVLYFIQNNAQYIALSHLEAATFQITNQLKLFTTAFFAVLLLKHKLSFSKWMSLVLLFVGVCLINFAPSSSPKRQGHWIGLLAVMVSCTISGFAAAWFEMVLKSTPQSITLRNVQMALFSLVPGFFFAVLVVDGQQVRENGFFDGYTIWTWFAIILQAFGGLVVAAVVKYADSILKGFAVSISIVISSIASVFIFDFHLTTNFVVGAMIVLLSTQLYISNKDDKMDHVALTHLLKSRMRLMLGFFAVLGLISFALLGNSIHFLDDYSHKTKQSYMFYATNDNYACNVMISVDRLQKFHKHPSIDLSMIVTDGVSEKLRKSLQQQGVKLIEKSVWKQDDPDTHLQHYTDSLTKLYVFEDLGYDKIVFIDSDTLIMRNLDHLFLLPPIETYWAPRAYWLNQPFITSVLLVVDPKFGQLQKLRDWLKHEKGNVFDMDTLNLMWINKAGILPEEYTILDKDFDERKPENRKRYESAYIVHFSASIGKPWNTPRRELKIDPNKDPILYEVFNLYWDDRERVCPH